MRTTGSKHDDATTLWDYINRAMPLTRPEDADARRGLRVTAYVLHLSDVLPGGLVLSDRESLQKLQRCPTATA